MVSRHTSTFILDKSLPTHFVSRFSPGLSSLSVSGSSFGRITVQPEDLALQRLISKSVKRIFTGDSKNLSSEGNCKFILEAFADKTCSELVGKFWLIDLVLNSIS